MNKRNNFVDNEVPAHKKKSNKKGLSRADHKHIYETVLLTRNYHSNFGDSEVKKHCAYLNGMLIVGRNLQQRLWR